MFGFLKNKSKGGGKANKKPGQKSGKKPSKAKAPQKPSREELIAQATANAAAAREQIGDETLEKIRLAMLKKESSPLEQAKAKVRSMDQDKVRDNLRQWMREKE